MSDTDDAGDRTVMRPRAPLRPVAAAPAVLQDFLGSGLNRLVQAASPLLLLAAHVRDMFQPPDLDGLRNEATRAVREFEERARALGVAQDMTLTARYLLCTALDEAVLNTPWGDRSVWGAQTLLMIFHREAWGGEKFFQVLDRASQDPVRFIDLLELVYVCLALGFAGKYRVDERGTAKLDDTRRALYQKIAGVRGRPEVSLSPHWKGAEDRRNAVVRYVPAWVMVSLAAFLLCGTFAFLYLRLAQRAEPVAASLAQVGLQTLDLPPPPPPPEPPPPEVVTLKRLLAEAEAAGSLDVVEYGDRSVVSLHGDQFASGSAQLNPALTAILETVAQAINRLPGNLLVQGHTDDAPLRSLRYANNHELSAERAREVGLILKQHLVPGITLETVGRGPDQPRCTPPGTRQNRACNRRVEIVHFVQPSTGGASAKAP